LPQPAGERKRRARSNFVAGSAQRGGQEKSPCL